MNIEVTRAELARTRVDDSAPAELAEGQARLRVDTFGLSANNVTYAVFGEGLGYWQFFPVPGDDAGEWGRIPVWGFADVVETRSDDVAVGERFLGYYPMGSELVITPGRSDEQGVTDLAPHRRELPSAYNRYARVTADPLYRADRERLHMLLVPLFFTSWLIDDFLVDNEDFGASQFVISSASSKTSAGVAYLAHQRGVRVIGLTSPGNVGFVEELGIYDEVVVYDDVDNLAVAPSVYVDVAGNRDVLAAVHRRLSGSIEHSMTVGDTHWDHEAAEASADVPPPKPEFFFAPNRISKRSKDWGRAGLDERLAQAWHGFVDWVDGWIELRQATGVDEVIDVYQQVLAGRPDPRLGFTCSLPADTGSSGRPGGAMRSTV